MSPATVSRILLRLGLNRPPQLAQNLIQASVLKHPSVDSAYPGNNLLRLCSRGKKYWRSSSQGAPGGLVGRIAAPCNKIRHLFEIDAMAHAYFRRTNRASPHAPDNELH